MAGERMTPGQAERGVIAGPSGDLEILVEKPRLAEGESPHGVAVIAHPHPLYGGTLDNKVVYTVARAALDAGCWAVRFNFRGVGRSEGAHDNGVGEGEDFLTAVAHARACIPDRPLAVAGFSFGSYIALREASKARAAGVLTVAPPLLYAGRDPIPAPGVPWWMIHGDADEVVDYDDSVRRAQASAQPPERLETVHGVGHFFHGELGPLRDFAKAFFDAVI